MNSPFAKIYPENQGSLQKKAFLVFIIALFLIYKSNAVWDNEDANGDGIVTPLEEEEAIATSDSWAIPGIILFFSSIGLLVFGWFRDKRADPNTRLCLSCNESVKISDIMQNISFEVLGVTDTTQAVHMCTYTFAHPHPPTHPPTHPHTCTHTQSDNKLHTLICL